MCGNMKSKASFLCVVMISVATLFLIMYYHLFNQLTDVIEQLKQIQSKAEEIYINANSDDDDK